ncbi:hypothetical protein DFH11DRAFT_1539883 [Phellopilus nigrolimitatus]|nr:hypothetical protein DFH11DRAFT_1539883 [Phellopilus nigrolimitatus]
MSLIVTLPILVGLGGRILFSYANPSSGLSSHSLSGGNAIGVGDLVVQGLFQGVLLQYVFAEYPIFAPALALVLAGRALLDFSYSDYTDVHKLGFIGMSAIVGFAGSYLLTIVLEDYMGLGAEEPGENTRAHVFGRSTLADGRSHAPALGKKRVGTNAMRVLPQESRVGVNPTEMTSSTLTMEQMGYTGLGRLLDLELANLRKRAATAEADRRRCKEERKWAVAQGDKGRATQLESYTREADRRIIEATRASHPGQLSSAVAPPPPVDSFPQHFEEHRGSFAYDYDIVPPKGETTHHDHDYPDYSIEPRKKQVVFTFSARVKRSFAAATHLGIGGSCKDRNLYNCNPVIMEAFYIRMDKVVYT